LDIKGPNLVKGIQLEGNRVLGVAEQFSDIYYAEGADELIYQDVVASLYMRNSLLDVVQRTAKQIFIPLTVAGGIRSIDDIRALLRAGADKVAINTAAVENPKLLSEAAKVFGSQCIVASIEAYGHNGKYQVWVDYGRQVVDMDAIEWAKRVVDLGVGEILLTSIDREGTGRGYDLNLIEKVAAHVSVPVIACGGAGREEDFIKAVKQGAADAVSAASVFHYNYMKPVSAHTMTFNDARLRMGEPIDSGNIEFLKDGYGGFKDIMTDRLSIPAVKQAMRNAGIAVRGTRGMDHQNG